MSQMTNENALSQPAFLTASFLREIATYDTETGLFTSKVSRGSRTKPGDILGSLDAKGYRQIMIRGYYFRAARLAWLYMTGEWPQGDIDHIDRKPFNDSWANLRDVTRSENARNRGATSWSGLKGVYASGERFMAQISINRKNIYLGTFTTIEEASAAYKAARLEYLGEEVDD